MDTRLEEPEAQTFVESALKMGGKSDEEAKKTGSMDRADEQVDALFAARYRTAASPVHRAVWDREIPLELFCPEPPARSLGCEQTMERSLEFIKRHRDLGTLFGEKGKLSQAVLDDLAGAGYWGLLIDPEYGGGGVLRFVRQISHPGRYHRAESFRPGIGSRMYRRRRSDTDLWHARSERAVPPALGQRPAALGVCPDGAVRRFRPDRA